jgi:CBS domain-containing protein
MKVKTVMNCNPSRIEVMDTVGAAAVMMKEFDAGWLAVVKGGEVVGVITDRDIVLRVVARGLDVATTVVGECMSHRLVYCRDTMDVQQAAHIMSYERLHRLLVKNENDEFVGMLSLGDIAQGCDTTLSGELVRHLSALGSSRR